MKKILAVLALSLCCVAVVQAQAVVEFEKNRISLGTFTEDKVQKCEFVFTNTGNKPLVINQAFSSCGCTVASFPKNPIQPGEKGTIPVTYNGKGKIPGRFTKTIIIRSNASNSTVRLYIDGNMKTDEK